MVLSIAAVGTLLFFSGESDTEVSKASWCFFGSCKKPTNNDVKRWKKEGKDKDSGPCFLFGGCKEPPASRIRTWKRQEQRRVAKKKVEEDQLLRKWGITSKSKDKAKLKAKFKLLTERQRKRLHRQILLRKLQTRALMLRRKVKVMATGQNATKVYGPGPPAIHRKSTLKTISTQLRVFPKSQAQIGVILDKLSAAENAKAQLYAKLQHAKQLTEVANKARTDVEQLALTAKAVIKKAKADSAALQLQTRHVTWLEARAASANKKYLQLKDKESLKSVKSVKLPNKDVTQTDFPV